jgi:hypothetical protein
MSANQDWRRDRDGDRSFFAARRSLKIQSAK